MIPEYRRGVVRLPAADAEHAADERARAVRTVCHLANRARDAILVLEVLGLDPREGRPSPASTPSRESTEEID